MGQAKLVEERDHIKSGDVSTAREDAEESSKQGEGRRWRGPQEGVDEAVQDYASPSVLFRDGESNGSAKNCCRQSSRVEKDRQSLLELGSPPAMPGRRQRRRGLPSSQRNKFDWIAYFCILY